MPVAPSFQSYKQLVDKPFTKNGKLYITVEHPNTKNRRDVRWYSDSEYAKAYGKKMEAGKVPGEGIDAAWEFYWTKEGYPNLKHIRGFDNGPILVIRRNRPEDEEWLRRSIARYAIGIGWYIVSTDILPIDAPKHFKYLLLSWEECKDGDECHIKRPSELDKILSKKMANKEWLNFPSA